MARYSAQAVLTGFLLFSVHTADADAETESSEWSFKIAPYAWLAGTGGTIVTDGEETDFELSFDDILELTTGGFQLNAQARNGRFFFGFDGTWAQLGHGEDLLSGGVDVDTQSVRQLALREEMECGIWLAHPKRG